MAISLLNSQYFCHKISANSVLSDMTEVTLGRFLFVIQTRSRALSLMQRSPGMDFEIPHTIWIVICQPELFQELKQTFLVAWQNVIKFLFWEYFSMALFPVCLPLRKPSLKHSNVKLIIQVRTLTVTLKYYAYCSLCQGNGVETEMRL